MDLHKTTRRMRSELQLMPRPFVDDVSRSLVPRRRHKKKNVSDATITKKSGERYIRRFEIDYISLRELNSTLCMYLC